MLYDFVKNSLYSFKNTVFIYFFLENKNKILFIFLEFSLKKCLAENIFILARLRDELVCMSLSFRKIAVNAIFHHENILFITNIIFHIKKYRKRSINVTMVY